MENISKEIIVYKLKSQYNKPNLGLLRAVAEKIDGSYIPITSKNFCISEKVFVTHGYEEIDVRYKPFELFKVIVKENEWRTEDIRTERDCKYIITSFSDVYDLKPRELVEIIPSSLPDPNDMSVHVSLTPSTEYIYINDAMVCYGPFKWVIENENQISLKRLDSPLPGKGKVLKSGNIQSGTIEDLKHHILDCTVFEGNRKYFKSMTDLQNDINLNKIDYISDDDVVSHFVKLSKDIGFSGKKIDLDYLSVNVKKHPKYNHKDSLDKLKLLKEIKNEHDSFRKEVIEEFSKFFRSDLGEEVTRNYISINKDLYLSEIRDEYRAKLEHEFIGRNNDLSTLKEKIENKKQELIDLGRDIEERSSISADIIYGVKENKDLDSQIAQKETRLANLKEKIEGLLEKYSKYSLMEDIENKIAGLETEWDIGSRQKYKIEEQIKTLEALHDQNEDKLRRKLFELKPFVEAINGNTGAPNKAQVKKVSQQPIYVETPSGNAQNIITYIEQKLKKEHRNVSTLDVINITITLQQSFISFLAGLPGGGKTTLARLVAKIYGIQENRFLDIPVARGWTGQRDLIGFFNPISNKFQASSTGMYELLVALSNEAQNEDFDPPLSMILLDEANLSPMEHYWSSFMGLTDSRGTEGLQLGDKYVQIPENLRFISTVNYDSTTEYLSPRLIDRAPVIVLEPNTIITTSNQQFEEDTTPLIEVPISYKIMEKYFGRTDSIPEFLGPELKVYDEVKAVLEERKSDLGKPIIISNRKEIAIRQYCNKARPLMREVSTDDDLLAIDYAILQLILPLLRGHGKSFGKRLEKLRDVLINSDLERSSSYLQTIIINGDADLHTYDFFCW